VKRCLDKDRSRRIADASVATFVLNEPSPPAPEQRAAAVTQDRTARRARFAVAVVVACAAAAGAIVAGLSVWLSKPAPEAPLVTRLTITPPSPNPFRTTIGSNLHAAVSPDGRSVVYPDGRGALLVRPFDSLEARRLPGLGDPIDPFFSPDGQWIGFFNLTSALQKVAITGGPSAALVNLGGAAVRGGTWSEDNRIVFATAAATGLQLVSAEGGTPTSLTTPDRSKGEGDHHVLPQFLPRGRGVLFTILPVSGGLDRAQVAVLDLTSRTYKVILQGASHARYVATGHLIYASGGTLRAVPFDLDTLQVATTPPIPVLSQTAGAGGGAAYDVSPNGTLVYVTGQGAANTYYLFWVDRQGREEPLSAPPRSYLYPRLSPDGSRVALDIRDQDNDVWMWDLTRETLTRVTVDPGLDRFPVWTVDGRRLIFSTDRNGRREQLFIQNATDVGAPQPLLESSNQDLAMSVTKDGRVVVRRDFDLMLLTPNAGGGNPSIQPLVQTQFQEVTGALRPAVPRRHWRPLAGVTGWRGAAGVVSRRPRTLLHR